MDQVDIKTCLQPTSERKQIQTLFIYLYKPLALKHQNVCYAPPLESGGTYLMFLTLPLLLSQITINLSNVSPAY